ncbi:MAG: hypothetical protein NZ822_02450, partial [Patescibacteria group bacterium]|nr:hypothetical protein [Patescibacteria group bacterium]
MRLLKILVEVFILFIVINLNLTLAISESELYQRIIGDGGVDSKNLNVVEFNLDAKNKFQRSKLSQLTKDLKQIWPKGQKKVPNLYFQYYDSILKSSNIRYRVASDTVKVSGFFKNPDGLQFDINYKLEADAKNISSFDAEAILLLKEESFFIKINNLDLTSTLKNDESSLVGYVFNLINNELKGKWVGFFSVTGTATSSDFILPGVKITVSDTPTKVKDKNRLKKEEKNGDQDIFNKSDILTFDKFDEKKAEEKLKEAKEFMKKNQIFTLRKSTSANNPDIEKFDIFISKQNILNLINLYELVNNTKINKRD